MLKYRLYRLKQYITRLYYRIFHNIICCGFDNSILPKFGKGKYISVYRKGSYIDIINEDTKNFIRIIPSQESHGIYVERWENNRITSRNILEYRQLNDDNLYCDNREVISYQQK